MPDSNTLERLLPAELRPEDVTGQEALRLGSERYEFAAKHVRPGRLLDAACGVGYGTEILMALSPRPITALGVDLSEEAIAHARENYARQGLQFATRDVMSLADPEGFDTIVSIETIEHLPDPAGLVARFVSLLRPRGILIASVPVTPSVDANPYHLHDFTERSFRRLFEPHDLIEIDSFHQVQPYTLHAVLARSEPRMQDVRRSLPAYYLRHPGALARRVWSLATDGLANRYLTIVWQRHD